MLEGSDTRGEGTTPAEGGTGDSQSGGAGATAPQPSRVFVDGRWMTAEDLALERSQLVQENAEQRGRLEAGAVTQLQAAPPAGPEPAWAQLLREQNTDENAIQQLIAQERQGQQEETRSVVLDEISKLSQQASQMQGRQEAAKSQFLKQYPDFDESQMHGYLAGDPAAKEGFDGFNTQGKHYQAFDYAWSKRLLGGGQAVNEQGRQHARVPANAGAPRMREESKPAAGTKPKIPKEVLEEVSFNADEEAITEYMRHRRKGTALDLDEPPPAMWNPSRR